MTAVAVLSPVDTLVTGAVDYAGLFPPAGLDMPTAVRHYAEYRADGQARALGRFILPATRLEEFADVADRALPRRRSDEPWRLSALVGTGGGTGVGGDIAADLERVTDFNEAHADVTPGRAIVDSVEAKASTEAAIASVIAATPRTLELFVEVPLTPDPAPLLAALARRGARAKVRTGGVTPESIPSPAALARFLIRAAAAGVGFKATAGLHHPLRGEHALTYADDSPRAVMHGFLNLFLATAFTSEGMSEADAVAVLEEMDPGAFRFGPHSVGWRDRQVTTPRLQLMREQRALAFGSCSFREPIDELRTLRLL
jgi:hypothetical protein